MRIKVSRTCGLIFLSFLCFATLTMGADIIEEKAPAPVSTEVMSNERLQELIKRIDSEFTGQPGYWNLKVSNLAISIITDVNADRMRIVIPIMKSEEIDASEMQRLLQANFDTALDARYALARGVLWGTFIHPLSSLSDKDFLSGLGQTINVVLSYGKSYSSGMFSFGGGDSGELLEKKIIEELMRKGEII